MKEDSLGTETFKTLSREPIGNFFPFYLYDNEDDVVKSSLFFFEVTEPKKRRFHLQPRESLHHYNEEI